MTNNKYYPIKIRRRQRVNKLAFITICIVSVVFVSIDALLGYFLFNWACPTGNIFFVIGAYVCWTVTSVFGAFYNAYINNKIKSFLLKKTLRLRAAYIAAGLWAAMLVVSVIYPWFKLPLTLYPWNWLKTPYTIGLILVQGVGTQLCLGLAGGAFFMVSLITYGDKYDQA